MLFDTLDQAIEEYLHTHQLDRSWAEATLVELWQKIAGEQINSSTQRVFVKQGILYVQLFSAPLKHELNLRKSQILALLKEHSPDYVTDINFM